MAIKISNFGMGEMGKIVIIAMNNDGTLVDGASMEPVGRSPADNLSETKSQETDTSHQKNDEANQTHFLSPGTLLLGAPDTCTKEHQTRVVKVDNGITHRTI